MKVLWFAVTPVQSGMTAFGQKDFFNGGGWIDSLLNAMPYENGHLEIWMTFLTWWTDKLLYADSKINNNIHYIGIPSESRYLDKTSSKMKRYFKEIIEFVDPDLIHIFGTETENTYNLLKLSHGRNTLVSITGLVHIYNNYYFGGIYNELKRTMTMRDVMRGSLFKSYKKMIKNGETEKKSLKLAVNVTGRTNWDNVTTNFVNPKLKYFFCNENLRNAFYKTRWNVNKCERFSIFTSSSASPLKGVHQLFRALPYILNRYPKTKVYVIGSDPREKGLRRRIKRTGYQKYLCQLMTELNINDSVVFVGGLSEDEMAARCALSHVYVLPSFIENSPNSLCEAMIMGVPSIASNVGGVPDLLLSGEEGFLYPSDEYYMLASRVIQIFSNDNLAKKFSVKAREKALIRHDRKQNGQTMFEIYENILGL